MKFFSALIFSVVSVAVGWAAPASLKDSTFTQIIKDVQVVSRATQAATPAKIADVFKAPDLIRTGPESLAELIAADKTVTRVGANTVFSFEAAGRTMNLEQGSVLFHSPKGKGGGTIRSKGASAAVLGTTIVVTATVGGGFKAIVLEGKGQITLPNGSFRVLQAGQVTFVLPGAQRFGPQVNINLQKLVENSRLVQGFEQELPSKPVIQAAIERQLVLLTKGVAEDTQMLVGNQATEESVNVVDSTIIQQVVQQREDRLALAKSTDLVLTPASLMGGVVNPTDYPAHLFLDRIPFDLPALGSLNFSGLVAKNLTIAATVSQLDFTPVLNQTDFNFAAEANLNILASSLQLTATLPHMGSPQLRDVRLAGRQGLSLPSGSSISVFHVGNAHFLSGAAMSLNNVSFDNSGGQIHLKAGQGLNLTAVTIGRTASTQLEGASINLNAGSYNVNGTATINASATDLNTSGSTTIGGNTVSLQATGDTHLRGTTVSATTLANLNAQQDVRIAGGSYTVSGPGGNATVSASRNIIVDRAATVGSVIGSAAEFQANTINMNATRDITLTDPVLRGFSTLNLTANQNLSVTSGSMTGASSMATASLTAAETLTVTAPTVASLASISLSARTLNLANVNFPAGSTVNLFSQNGLLAANPNTGASSVPNHINFLINVKYDGNPAELFVGNGITLNPR